MGSFASIDSIKGGMLKIVVVLIQPQRTNNVLEQFFRKLIRTYCKKNGFNSMGRVLKTMLPDTPLTMNLKNN